MLQVVQDCLGGTWGIVWDCQRPNQGARIKHTIRHHFYADIETLPLVLLSSPLLIYCLPSAPLQAGSLLPFTTSPPPTRSTCSCRSCEHLGQGSKAVHKVWVWRRRPCLLCPQRPLPPPWMQKRRRLCQQMQGHPLCRRTRSRMRPGHQQAAARQATSSSRRQHQRAPMLAQAPAPAVPRQAAARAHQSLPRPSQQRHPQRKLRCSRCACALYSM